MHVITHLRNFSLLLIQQQNAAEILNGKEFESTRWRN